MKLKEIIEKRMYESLYARHVSKEDIEHFSLILLAELQELITNAERWLFYANAQTALYLGTDKDPNDETVDWLKECNLLVDK